MIICSLFINDTDYRTQGVQHDVYGPALWIIVSGCFSLSERAGASPYREACRAREARGRFDHRTLQFAHDLLAAAWRFRNDFRQMELPLLSSDGGADVGALWLDWLRSEVASWDGAPHLVRAVSATLADQNRPPGYTAETFLAHSILDRFRDVPWLATVHRRITPQ